ncbi:MAG: RRXRR domain-containing protein [Planctomycetaceae bacterium]|nr:RRXRR domain-containing protein [Planctomycetaceae bacterium]
MSVFVIDKRKKPLMPCSEKRARQLLERRRAVVHRLYPFTIRLKDRIGGDVQPVRIKLDPGSTVTGLAVVREHDAGQHVLCLAEITHRGHTVAKGMKSRSAYRRRRRTANLRYREPRFDNRRRPDGWLTPSMRSRIGNILTWVARLRRVCPVAALSQERVKFDLQQMEDPEISGAEYQQGTLAGYELREYLLEKWGRTCAYCGEKDVPLQIEHIHPKSKGGSDRVSNLVLACEPCNRRKGNRPVEVFLKDTIQDPDEAAKVLAKILKQAKAPLKDVAAVNATRWELFRRLQATGLPVETGSGGRTKWNRIRLDIPKSHALDAACVGDVEAVSGWQIPVLKIEAKGRGQYQRTNVTDCGFPRGEPFLSRKMVRGFRTGDIVKAVVTTGTKIGTYLGRVAVRKTGDFKVKTANGPVDHLSWKACTVQQRADGYAYSLGETIVKSVQYVADLLHPTAQAGGSRKSERMCLVPG